MHSMLKRLAITPQILKVTNISNCFVKVTIILYDFKILGELRMRKYSKYKLKYLDIYFKTK